jgi:DNA repair protein RadC
LENIMKDVSLMSRAELIRELITSTPMTTARVAATYAKTRARALAADRDALVSYKLAVARELLLRDLAERMKAEPILTAPGTVRDWLRLYCANLEHEVFIILLLDSQNRLIEAQELFRGTLSQTSVYPREVVKYTLARNAAAVLFAHNHPSGVAEPSRADELLTQNLKQALALVDVRVLDHFVVAGTSTVSFAERGLI